MSEMQQESPFDAVGSEVVDALDSFDKNRKGLYFALGDIAGETPDVSVYHPTISPRITETAESFGALAASVRKSEDDIDYATASILRLWLDDDSERVKRFMLLAGGDDHADCFGRFDEGDIGEILNAILDESEDDEAFTENVTVVFRASLAGDVEMLSHHVQDRRAERIQDGEIEDKAAKEVSVVIDLARVRKHALDVAKIAVGVSLGLVVHNRFSK